jgi:bifunctional DNA-binding transcriptional regulator/antitoxin component of YhaV-PrlF toxin-antitoxin module
MGTTVVLRRDGTGALTPVDRRGRVLLPAWLRRRAAAEPLVVFVAARRPDASLVVVTPAADLDHLADALARG